MDPDVQFKLNNMRKGRDDVSAVVVFAAIEANQKFGETTGAFQNALYGQSVAQPGQGILKKKEEPRNGPQ